MNKVLMIGLLVIFLFGAYHIACWIYINLAKFYRFMARWLKSGGETSKKVTAEEKQKRIRDLTKHEFGDGTVLDVYTDEEEVFVYCNRFATINIPKAVFRHFVRVITKATRKL